MSMGQYGHKTACKRVSGWRSRHRIFFNRPSSAEFGVDFAYGADDVVGVGGCVEDAERKGDVAVDEVLGLREVFLAVAVGGPRADPRERGGGGGVGPGAGAVALGVVRVGAGHLRAVHVEGAEALLKLAGKLGGPEKRVDLEAGVALWVGDATEGESRKAADPLHDPCLQAAAVVADAVELAELGECDRCGKCSDGQEVWQCRYRLTS